MSLKIQSYMEYLKEQEGENKEVSKEDEPSKIKILHREEKDNNEDAFEPPKTKPYVSRFGGWTSVDSKL